MRQSNDILSALFVDFDNIYLGLRDQDPSLAKTFATKPMQWLEWMIQSIAYEGADEPGLRRRIAVRRCYLNPKSFGEFRPYFMNAAFETIDCPALTHSGKTSADVHMVLDIVESLSHDVGYDEYIILSADADFTPVLMKLRKWGRKTVVLAIGNSSPAYRAASEFVISQDMFIEDALGGVEITAPKPRRGAAKEKRGDKEGRDKYAEYLVQRVQASPEPLALGRLATELRKRFPELMDGWRGASSFRGFLQSLDFQPLLVSEKNPGYLFDPNLHSDPAKGDEIESWGDDAEGDGALQALVEKISDLTDTPAFPPATYRFIFEAIANEVNANGFQLSVVERSVRDKCRDQGLPVSRSTINYIVYGIGAARRQLKRGGEKPEELARIFLRRTQDVIDRAQIVLSDKEQKLLEQWLVG